MQYAYFLSPDAAQKWERFLWNNFIEKQDSEYVREIAGEKVLLGVKTHCIKEKKGYTSSFAQVILHDSNDSALVSCCDVCDTHMSEAIQSEYDFELVSMEEAKAKGFFPEPVL